MDKPREAELTAHCLLAQSPTSILTFLRLDRGEQTIKALITMFPGFRILNRRVDYRHYGYGGDIADVIIDEELEVFDVDEGEVPGVEITVRVSEMLN